MTTPAPRPAYLLLTGWHGFTATPILIVGETPKRYRITPSGARSVRLAGPYRYVEPGKVVLVPKTAVSFDIPKNAELCPP